MEYVNVLTLILILIAYHNLCEKAYNQCVTIFSGDFLLLLLFTLPWYRERTDEAMAVFVFVAVCNFL